MSTASQESVNRVRPSGPAADARLTHLAKERRQSADREAKAKAEYLTAKAATARTIAST